MATYSTEDFERIAAAIGEDVADVMAHKEAIENAADLYRLDCGLPSPERAHSGGTPPYKMQLKMQTISKNAQRLLKHLGIPIRSDRTLDIQAAYDGPGSFEILKALSWAVDHHEDPVITATRRIGRLAEILKAVEATKDIEQWARRGANGVIEFGRLTVPKGHQGDVAVNDWIAAMMSISKQITGKDPGTSVGAPGSKDEGIPGGPLIRFMEAAGKPLGIQHSPDSWRGRVRDLLTDGRKK